MGETRTDTRLHRSCPDLVCSWTLEPADVRRFAGALGAAAAGLTDAQVADALLASHQAKVHGVVRRPRHRQLRVTRQAVGG